MNTEEVLEKYGLSNKEAKLYLATLCLGEASITQLAKKAELKRPTTYLVIDLLLKKNLLIEIPKGKKVYYKAENPEILIEDIETNKLLVAEVLPTLKALYSKNLKTPQVSFYQGKNKVLQVLEQAFKAKEIWAVFSPDKFLKVFTNKDNEHLFRILIRYGGIIYDLFEDTPKAREFAKEKYRTAISEVKFLPKKLKFSTDIMVFDNKVVLISFENITATVIEDESITQTQKILLQFIWQNL